jgi:hypothetical protein
MKNRAGLTTSTLPSEVVQNIEDEEDELDEVIEQINAQQEQTENSDEEEEVLAGTSLHISSARKQANEHLNKQATRMKIISDATHPPVNVILPIPGCRQSKGRPSKPRGSVT